MRSLRICLLGAFLATVIVSAVSAGETLAPVSERFAALHVDETPDFQRHVIPLAGRLGCNGRACHGSFQGRGDFRLSLFGYDFEADHSAMTKDGGEPRVNLDIAEASLILQKPTMSIDHEGGERMTADSWEYRVFKRWIDEGAKWDAKNESRLTRLEIIPAEIIFSAAGATTPLKAIAHWADGTSEDVSPLCRFRTNDDAVATVDEEGTVTSTGVGDTHIIAFYDNGVTPVPVILPVSDRSGPNFPPLPTPTKVDTLILAKLQKLGALPSDLCTDAEFLRRASLDLTGTLPTPDEIESFLVDASNDKRTRKIDEMLERPSYVAWWTTRLCDMTGASENTQIDAPFRNEYATQWYEWLHERVRKNISYDEIVAGIALATSRKPDQSYEDHIAEMALYFREAEPAPFTDSPTMPYFWTRRNVRDRDSRALAFSHAFLGLRIECAQCHKHPFDQWSKQDFQDFSMMFANVQYGIAPDGKATYEKLQAKYGFDDKTKPKNRNELRPVVSEGTEIFWPEIYVGQVRPNRRNKGPQDKTVQPAILGGVAVTISSDADSREQLMEWMRSPANPYFSRAFVNRAWANYFGVGIVEPPDDQNLANPPSNAPLLDYLAKGFIEHRFDMKWLHREIMTSDAYQRSWRPNETNRLDTRNFSHARLRRLPAEVARDAMVQATTRDSEIHKAVVDATNRAIGPSNARTRSNQQRYVLTTFGKSERAANCDCERSDEPSILQTVYLRNDSELLKLVGDENGWIRETLDRWDGSAGKELAKLDEDRRSLTQSIERLAAAEAKAGKAERERKEERFSEMKAAAQGKLRKLNERAAELRSQTLSVSEDELAKWIREAYLRTVSRVPTVTEFAIASKQFEETNAPADAMRDVLWALLNTKEFIVNH